MQSQRKRSPRLVRRNRALASYLRVVLCGAKSLGVISIELRLKILMVHVTVFQNSVEEGSCAKQWGTELLLHMEKLGGF